MAFFGASSGQYTYNPYVGPYGTWFANDGSGSYAGDAEDYQHHFGTADPGTNVVTPGGVQNFAPGTNPVFPDVGNSEPVGMSPADAYKWYSDQTSSNRNNFDLAALGLIGGPALATALGGGFGTAAAANSAIDPITLPSSATYLAGGGGAAASQGALSSIGASLDAGAPVSSLLTQIHDTSGLFGAAGSAASGAAASGAAGGAAQGAAGAGQVASNVPSWLSALGPYAPLIGAGLGLVDSALQPDSTTQTNNATNNSTSTSSLQLPSQITGAAGTALDRANQLLTQGQQFAPTPYILNQAAGNLASLGQNTAPLTSSFASGANINPYLDTEFNAAADATQNRLGSEFANAGQYGSPQNQQARSQELQTLAADIYGPGYQNAQQLQYGAQEAGVSRGLQQQDANLNRTLQAAQVALPLGTYMQQQAQQQANAPYTNLSQYISQLGSLAPFFPGTYQQSQAGTQTGNYTQPLYNNPLTSAIGGASLGAYYGNLLNGQPQQQGSSFMGGTQSPQNMQIQPWGGYNAYAY